MSDPNQEFQAPPPPTVEAEPERQRPTYLLYGGIGLVVIGIIVIVLGIVGMIVGGIGDGSRDLRPGRFAWRCSVSSACRRCQIRRQRMSTIGTLTGIFFEPSSVFRNLRAHPQFMAALIIVGLLNGIYVAAFVHRITPERIINFTVDKPRGKPDQTAARGARQR